MSNQDKKDNEKSSEKPISEAAELLRSIDTESSEAKSNATSISDGNGGRIELDEKGDDSAKRGVEPHKK